MRIGFDARLINETGVGRYIRNLLHWLSTIDDQNEYIIYLLPDAYKAFPLPNNRWQKKQITVRWHTIQEQFILPFVCLRDGIQLLHVPYFTVPIFFPGRIVCTIHDLTILHEKTGKATTLPGPLYRLKHLGYRFVIACGIRRSTHVITVSGAVRQEVLKTYHLSSEKVDVTYEGVDERLLMANPSPPTVLSPYFLYVGNVYPHKNVDILLETMETLLTEGGAQKNPVLVFVGKEDFFYRRLQQAVRRRSLESSVLFLGHVTDSVLAGLYTHALATVFPSKREGFGLPAIEALACNCPVIVSDIPVFREVLTCPGVTFVPVDSVHRWVAAFQTALKKRNREDIWSTKKEKDQFLRKFSWEKMAQETATIYEHCNRIRSGK